MKDYIKKFGLVLLLIGLAVIFSGFLLLLPEQKRNNIFWLDLFVTCLVFAMNFQMQFDLINIRPNPDSRIGRLGIRITYIYIYTFLAISLIVSGFFIPINFNLQLLLQIVFAFILVLGYFFSYISAYQIFKVQTEHEAQQKRKNDIVEAANQFERFILESNSGFGHERLRIGEIKEHARYLAPSNDEMANAIETEIANTIRQAYLIARTGKDSSQDILLLLNKCDELLNIRKQSYSH